MASWQDILAKHHPVPAFFAAVISNIFSGNKAKNKNPPHDENLYNEPSSSDYSYGGAADTDTEPQYYYSYPPTPIPPSPWHNKPKKNKNKSYNENRQIDYYNAVNDKQAITLKGFWGRRNEHVLEKRKGYGEKGTLMRSYVDWNGEEVVEEREYQLQSYYELQLSPVQVVETQKNKNGSREAWRTRYN